jgi:hypothetical protein
VRKGGAGAHSEINSGTGELGEFLMAGDEIGM